MAMLSGLTNYGAVSAKVSVMKRKLLSKSNYEELIQKSNVAEAAQYLKNETAYGSALSNTQENALHRGELERLLRNSYADDVARLYNFDNGENRHLYSYVILKTEIELIKNILRRLNNNEENEVLYDYPAFFARHFTIRPQQLLQSKSIGEFLENLSDSRYRDVVAPLLSSSEHRNLFSVETALDTYYSSEVGKLIAAMPNRENRDVLSMTNGSETDARNLLCIYRCKKYFNTPSEFIYSLLLPNRYKLSKADMIALAETKTAEEFLNLARRSAYRSLFAPRADGFYDRNYASFVYALHKKAAKQYPYTIESAVSYLHFKETELQNITSIIEGIRYGLPAEEIATYITGFGFDSAGTNHE